MRHWFLTNTFYSNWLPGEPRGSVTSVRERRSGDPAISSRLEHDIPGTPYEEPMPGLERAAAARLKGPTIHLNRAQAECMLEQYRETATPCDWTLLAVAIMFNHVHIVVQVPGDPPPRKILADFKAYAMRRLNRHYGHPPAETWWATNGSKRKLVDETAVLAAIQYELERQPNSLVSWAPDLAEG